ncbi:MAG TPA: hypothetical protein ENI49_02960 [Thermoplasmatales archaeon]|nr:hypothetical protein [Thermoplasmatales archaeon]
MTKKRMEEYIETIYEIAKRKGYARVKDVSASSLNDVRKAHHRDDIGMNKHGQAPEIRGVGPSESINFLDEGR